MSNVALFEGVAPAHPKNPSRRALAQLARFEAAVATAVAEHRAAPRTPAGHLLYKADGRTPMFYLEGLARLGRAIGPSRKAWDAWLPRWKEIEDRFGGYDYWLDLGTRASSWGLAAPVVAYLGERSQQALGALEYALARGGFWATDAEGPTGPGPAGDELRAFLDDLEFDKPKRERKELAAFLRDEIREIDEALADGSLDLTDVEHGIHELRRKLRWLPIYGLATAGKVVLDADADAGALAKYVTPERLASPYNKLPGHPDEREPVRLHQAAFLAVSHLVAEIGRLKDRALWSEEIPRSARVCGLDPARSLDALGPARVGHEEVVAAVRALVDETIVGDRALAVLADHLDEQT